MTLGRGTHHRLRELCGRLPRLRVSQSQVAFIRLASIRLMLKDWHVFVSLHKLSGRTLMSVDGTELSAANGHGRLDF